VKGLVRSSDIAAMLDVTSANTFQACALQPQASFGKNGCDDLPCFSLFVFLRPSCGGDPLMIVLLFKRTAATLPF